MSDLNLDVFDSRGSLGGNSSKKPSCQYSRHTRCGVWSLGWEDPLEEGVVTHSSVLAWRISWTEEPGGLQSTGSQRVGHDWSNLAGMHLFSAEYCVEFFMEKSWYSGFFPAVLLIGSPVKGWPNNINGVDLILDLFLASCTQDGFRTRNAGDAILREMSHEKVQFPLELNK